MITKIPDKEWREHKQKLKDLKDKIQALLDEIENEIEWMDG